MKVLMTLLLVGVLVIPVWGQQKSLTLPEMKKDLLILNLRKDNLKLRYAAVNRMIEQLEDLIDKVDKRKSPATEVSKLKAEVDALKEELWELQPR